MKKKLYFIFFGALSACVFFFSLPLSVATVILGIVSLVIFLMVLILIAVKMFIEVLDEKE